MPFGVLSLGVGLRDLAVHERAVDDAALEGVHGLEHHLSAGAVSLFRKAVCKSDEGVAALCAVVLAVHDDLRRAVALLPDIGAGEELYRVQHFAAVSYGGAAALALDVHDYLAVTLLCRGVSVDVHCREHSVDEILREGARVLTHGDLDFRLSEKSALLQNFHLNSVLRDPEFRKRLFDREVDVACLDHYPFFHFDSYYLRGASAPVFFASRLSSSLPTRVNPSWNTMDTSELVNVYSANAAE